MVADSIVRPEFARVLGRRGSGSATLVCVGGMHGNEPAGLDALQRVLAALDAGSVPLCGHFVALAGNLSALRRGQRFCEVDLNRIWVPERLASARLRRHPGVEEQEQRDLHDALMRELARAPGSTYFLDLHTTSSDSAPFAVLSDTLRNRAFARAFPVPLVLGLEEELVGTITDFFNEQGVVTVGFEAGRHDDPVSVDLHEAAVWLALGAAGLVPRRHARVVAARARLRRAVRGVPRVLEIRHRHPIAAGDAFRMRDGYANFMPIAHDHALADDCRGTVRARMRGRVFMPLYQPQGEDGFFIVRRVNRAWLVLSAGLRRLRVDRIAAWLPGVCRAPDCPRSYLVDRRVARWLTRPFFHLLGYRCYRAASGPWRMRRRDGS